MTDTVYFNPLIHEDICIPSCINTERLPLIEAQIISLVYQNGYTLRTNQELAEKYSVTMKAIRQAIQRMQEQNYIAVSRVVYERGKTGRMIRLIGG